MLGPRAAPVVEAVSMLVMADLGIARFHFRLSVSFSHLLNPQGRFTPNIIAIIRNTIAVPRATPYTLVNSTDSLSLSEATSELPSKISTIAGIMRFMSKSSELPLPNNWSNCK